MIKAVIFDYNGVLVDDLHLHIESYLMAAKELGIPLTKERIMSFISFAPEKKIKKYFGENLSDDEARRILQTKNKYYERLAKGSSIVFKGVPEVLNYLSEKYTLALVSNTLREYFNKTFPRELAARFMETMFVEEIDNPKPAPDSLLRMAEKLKTSKDECVYIGDSVVDVQTARAAGMKIILVATGNEKKADLLKEGVPVLDSIRELKRFL